MDTEQIVELLDKISFFEKFSLEEKEHIASFKTNIIRYMVSEWIIQQDDIETSLFVLLKGTVCITKKELPGVTINKLRAGSIFGEMSLLAKRPRSTNVIADGDAVVLKIDGDLLDQFDPELLNKFKDQIIDLLISRIDEMNKLMLSVIK